MCFEIYYPGNIVSSGTLMCQCDINLHKEIQKGQLNLVAIQDVAVALSHWLCQIHKSAEEQLLLQWLTYMFR